MKTRTLNEHYTDYNNLIKRNVNAIDEELKVLNNDVNIIIKRFNKIFKSKVSSFINIIEKINKKLIRFYGSLNELQALEQKRNKYKYFINNIPISKDTDMNIIYNVCKTTRIITEYNKLKKLYDNIDKLIERKNKLLSLRLSIDDYGRMNTAYNTVGRKIILNGGSYKISNNFGELILVKVRITERNYKPAIDWKATKELKQHFIKNDIPIFNKNDYLDAIAKHKEYTAKEYLIYYTNDFYYYIKWYGVKYSKVGLDYKRYKYKPSYQNNESWANRELLDKIHTSPKDIFDAENYLKNRTTLLSILHWLNKNYEDYSKSIVFSRELYSSTVDEINTDDY